jgi:3-methyladenine DNA glycosylase/8-oxoguanine DNA glycosylase
MRIEFDGIWRATNTPEGPVTTHITAEHGRVTVRAWGEGAAWALDAAPALIGAEDSDDGFRPKHPVLTDLQRRLRGLRITKSQAVTEALVPTIIEQKVLGIEARRSYAKLVRRYGMPAPGPGDLLLPPSPTLLSRTPAYAYHPFGIEQKRADTIKKACAYAHRLDETVRMDSDSAFRRLTALPGIGAWSAAEVALVALGDADAVSVGDFHLPHLVAFALAGEIRGTDARMLELLEPWRGHRARVIRLLELSGVRPPAFGPRYAPRSIATI